ncbi:carbonic anhydrase 2-like [Centruroides sculpturatus]|uniref:carbonic anhydrase 2-like n=1 Tax=Centruroides sculpturatus TaxID=218467 RepID=UPI000C6C8CF4|nr:carbonic anhydrase 2-like [Centruroides sculpturatus]
MNPEVFLEADFIAERRQTGPFSKIYTDPTTWPCLYKFCMGKNQSPINIDTEMLTINPKMGSLQFQNYDKDLENLTISNYGYSVVITIPTSSNVTISGKGIEEMYGLAKILIFFGKNPSKGSAHTINSKYFNMEIVFIHLNTKYEQFTNAPDAILALSILVKLAKSDNENLQPIVDSLEKIKNPDDSTKLTSLKIKELLPNDTDHYVKYKGSALIPECYDGTHTWIIPYYTIPISKYQLKKFITVKRYKEGEKQPKFFNNLVRPVQPLFDREIQSTLFVKNNRQKGYST